MQYLPDMQTLVQMFDKQPVIKQNGRNYLIIPLFNHSVATHPATLHMAANAVIDSVDWQKNQIDTIVSEEETGGFLAVCVAIQRNIPFTLAKQNPVHLPGEIAIEFSMAYNDKMTLHLNGVKKGDKVVIVEDFVDTGGTMIALIQALQKAGAQIVDIVALGEKVNMGGVRKIQQETGFLVKTVIKVDTTGDTSAVIGTMFD